MKNPRLDKPSDSNAAISPVVVTDRVRGEQVERRISFGDYSHSSFRQRPTSSEVDVNASASDLWWRSFLLGNPITNSGWRGKVSFIDLFASAGGLSLAFAEAAKTVGLRPESLFCADVDGRALEIYSAHFNPLFVFEGNVDGIVDVEGFAAGDLPEIAHPNVILDHKLKRLIGEVDVVLAGPPCQGHSSLNNSTRHEDPRNRFYLHPVVVGIALRAKAILIENVPGVRRDSSAVVQRAEQLLLDHGYSISSGVLKAEKLGWPQTRHRYFLLATKGESGCDLTAVVNELSCPPRPISWALCDLLDSRQEGLLYTSSNLSAENQQRIDWLFENDQDQLPDEFRPACHREKEHTYQTVYGRMRWDKPAGTITTGFMTPGRGRFIHPLRPRTLLPIEAARIQGFPDTFFGSVQLDPPIVRTEIVKWIGDAVPPPLGYPAAFCAVKSLLENQQITTKKPLQPNLAKNEEP